MIGTQQAIKTLTQMGDGGGNRQGYVPEARMRVEKAVARLAELIDQLHKRIDVACRAPEPQPEAACEKEPATNCELADWLRIIARQIDGYNTHISYLLDHLEL